jgi:hypothetical protein
VRSRHCHEAALTAPSCLSRRLPTG